MKESGGLWPEALCAAELHFIKSFNLISFRLLCFLLSCCFRLELNGGGGIKERDWLLLKEKDGMISGMTGGGVSGNSINLLIEWSGPAQE